jgi:hypothetical protein
MVSAACKKYCYILVFHSKTYMSQIKHVYVKGTELTSNSVEPTQDSLQLVALCNFSINESWLTASPRLGRNDGFKNNAVITYGLVIHWLQWEFSM